MENLLWKRLWTCRKTDYRMTEQVLVATTFNKNERNARSYVRYRYTPTGNRHEERQQSSTETTVKYRDHSQVQRPIPMKTEQAWNGIYQVVVFQYQNPPSDLIENTQLGNNGCHDNQVITRSSGILRSVEW